MLFCFGSSSLSSSLLFSFFLLSFVYTQFYFHNLLRWFWWTSLWILTNETTDSVYAVHVQRSQYQQLATHYIDACTTQPNVSWKTCQRLFCLKENLFTCSFFWCAVKIQEFHILMIWNVEKKKVFNISFFCFAIQKYSHARNQMFACSILGYLFFKWMFLL